jgi:DNA-binding XRE family transcriptional regulator
MRQNNNNIKLYRLKEHHTLLDLAVAVGISHSQLSLIERGYYLPSLEVAKELSKVFNAPVTELFPSTRYGEFPRRRGQHQAPKQQVSLESPDDNKNNTPDSIEYFDAEEGGLDSIIKTDSPKESEP